MNEKIKIHRPSDFCNCENCQTAKKAEELAKSKIDDPIILKNGTIDVRISCEHSDPAEGEVKPFVEIEQGGQSRIIDMAPVGCGGLAR